MPLASIALSQGNMQARMDSAEHPRASVLLRCVSPQDLYHCVFREIKFSLYILSSAKK